MLEPGRFSRRRFLHCAGTAGLAADLDGDSSLRWHGRLVPNGVPRVTYPGIKPGETFTYRYQVRQSGASWDHSHSGLQEQSGVYGPLVIEPASPEPFQSDRDHVVMLSDWTFEDPHSVLAKLKKKHSGDYNFQRRTVGDFFPDDQTYWLLLLDQAEYRRHGNANGLRWDFQVAPYLGISWVRKVFAASDLARRAGESDSALSLVAGLRLWS